MRRIDLYLGATALAVATLLMVGCTEQSTITDTTFDNRLIGEWETQDDGYELYMKINADKTGQLIYGPYDLGFRYEEVSEGVIEASFGVPFGTHMIYYEFCSCGPNKLFVTYDDMEYTLHRM